MFEIIKVDDFEVTIRDESHNISHIHQQGDGKWKCQRCDRYHCKHAKFVQQSGVQLLPRKTTPPDDLEIFMY